MSCPVMTKLFLDDFIESKSGHSLLVFTQVPVEYVSKMWSSRCMLVPASQSVQGPPKGCFSVLQQSRQLSRAVQGEGSPEADCISAE